MAILDQKDLERELLADLETYFNTLQSNLSECVGCKKQSKEGWEIGLQILGYKPMTESTPAGQAIVVLGCPKCEYISSWKARRFMPQELMVRIRSVWLR